MLLKRKASEFQVINVSLHNFIRFSVEKQKHFIDTYIHTKANEAESSF